MVGGRVWNSVSDMSESSTKELTIKRFSYVKGIWRENGACIPNIPNMYPECLSQSSM